MHYDSLTANLPDRLTLEVPSSVRLAAFFGLHVVLGLLSVRMPAMVNLHALAVFGIGLWWAFCGRSIYVAYAGAYVAGAEVFWRMSEVGLPWEFGKYAISALFIVALVRTRRIRGPLAALIYFGALIPSVWISIDGLAPDMARQLISFNLSGPFAVFVAAWLFSGLVIPRRSLLYLLLALVAPVLSMWTVAVYEMITAPEIVFVTASMAATSGNFGANQVSSMLGLAALMLYIILLVGTSSRTLKAFIIVTAAALLVQSALTFSRSGIALALGGFFIATAVFVRGARARATLLGGAAVAALVVGLLVVPRLNEVTGGAFAQRFQELSTTGRAELAAGELRMWSEHPLLGVGPGGGTVIRSSASGEAETVASHTEFTRMVAEHGLLGLLSLMLLVGMCVFNVVRAPGRRERAVVLTFVAYAFAFMLVSAFRLAAPAFLIGFTFARLYLNDHWHLHAERYPARDVPRGGNDVDPDE